jgi:hypothetical protein
MTMTCPRCQGLIIREYWEERCLNCGHRTNFVPPPSTHYRPLPVIGPSPTAGTPAHLRDEKHAQKLAYYREWKRKRTAEQRAAQADARREQHRVYMRAYMRQYRQRPGRKERANAASRSWRLRQRAATNDASRATNDEGSC